MDAFAREYQDAVAQVLSKVAPDGGTAPAPPETKETVLREILKVVLTPTFASSVEDGSVKP
jgi:hypothetical protein